MAAAKTEMILPALQITDPLSFAHSPMDNYPKLEEMMMLSSSGTPFLTASAPEGTVFGSGEPGDHYDHLPGGKHSAFWVFSCAGHAAVTTELGEQQPTQSTLSGVVIPEMFIKYGIHCLKIQSMI